MILPFVRGFAAAVIGRKNQRGVALIFGHGLHKVPQLAQMSVHSVCGVEIFQILTGIGPIISFG